ncbi:MAG: hypothetical protein V3S69_01070, partial [Dehalococcoidales bacterium]
SLIAKGRGDTEVLNRLEQRILRERDELIGMLEDQGVPVRTAESIVSEETLPARPGEAQPEGRADTGLHGKGSVETIESAVGEENPNVEAPKTPEGSTKSSTEGSASTIGLGAKEAEPKDWSAPKNNTARRSDAGAYTTYRTFDNKSTSGYRVVLNHKGNSRLPFKSLGLFNSEVEAKKAATAHWESIYVNKEDVDLPGQPTGTNPRLSKTKDTASPDSKSAVGGGLGVGPTTKFFAEATEEEKAKTMVEEKFAVHDFLAKVAPESPLLQHFLKKSRVGGRSLQFDEEALNRHDMLIGMDSIPEAGIGNNWSPELDIISITGKGLPVVDLEALTIEENHLDLNKPKDLAEQVMIVEHEMIHAYTTPYITKVVETWNNPESKADKSNVEYLLNVISKLEFANRKNLLGDVSVEARARIEYIVSQPTVISAVSEFLAVMSIETEAANEIYKVLAGKIPEKTLRERISALLASIKESFLALGSKEMNEEINAEELQQSILNAFIAGKTMKEQKADEWAHWRAQTAKHVVKMQEDAVKQYQEMVNQGFGVGPTAAPQTGRKASFDYLNYAVASMLNSKLERRGKRILGKLHNTIAEMFPMYADVAKKLVGIYDGSPALQQFIHTITGEGVDKHKKADILSQFAAINAQRTETTNNNTNLLHALTKGLSDQEKTDLSTFINDMPLHDYFLFAHELTTAESIEAKAELLRKELWKVNNRAVRDVDKLVDWHIDGEQTGKLYNLDASPAMQGSKDTKFARKLRTLLALESIKRVGAKKFENLLRHKELMD